MGNEQSQAYQQAKQLHLSKSREQKRAEYRFPYVALDAIPTWLDYYRTEIKDGERNRTQRSTYTSDDLLNQKISLLHHDITELEVDVIINSGSKSLFKQFKGEVNAAIANRADVNYKAEYKRVIGRCTPDRAELTGGYILPAKYVMHIVPPGDRDETKLACCYRTCLELAKIHQIKTIAFPCIGLKKASSFDDKTATRIALQTVRDWLESNHRHVERIIFCVYQSRPLKMYNHLLQEYFPVESRHQPGGTRRTSENRPSTSGAPDRLPPAFQPMAPDVGLDGVLFMPGGNGAAYQPDNAALQRTPSSRTPSVKYYILKEKNKYINMDLDAKRRQYLTESKAYVPLDDVLRWPAYQARLRGHFTSRSSPYQCEPDINSSVSLWRGDITELEIDAIVTSAAKKEHGGEVNTLVVERAGATYKEELELDGPLGQFEARVTGGFRLPAKYVINVAAPKRAVDVDLIQCYQSVLDEALEKDIHTLAFPCIATRKSNGFPKKKAATIALECVRRWMETDRRHEQFERVIFCVYNQEEENIYKEEMRRYFPTDL